jgi:hypothetical protein
MGDKKLNLKKEIISIKDPIFSISDFKPIKGSILDISVSSYMNLICTVSEDKYLRIFEYKNNKMIIC